MPNWFSNKESDLKQVGDAVTKYISLVSIDEVARYLEQAQKLLLTDSASKLLQEVVESARKNGSDAEINTLEIHQRLLERARVVGIQKAVEEEKRHQDEVSNSVAAFMGSSVDTIRQVWEKHYRILRTREAIRLTQRLVEQIEKRNQHENPMYKRSRALMIRFLQDARERGVDYAEEQFHQDMAKLMMQMFNDLHGNSNT
jgi:hypothetical protein